MARDYKWEITEEQQPSPKERKRARLFLIFAVLLLLGFAHLMAAIATWLSW